MALLDAAHKRGIRVITDLVMNHTVGPHAVVPGVAPRPGRAVRRLLRVERHQRQVHGRPGHLRRHRGVELDLRPGAPAVLLAPVLLPPARPQLRQPGRAGGDARRPAVLAGPRHRRVPAGRGALPVRAGGHQLREPARDARVPQALPQGDRRRVPGPGAAGRGQPVAGRRGRVLRRPEERRRRVPHGVPLPADAAHLHGGAPRVALPDLGDPGPDAGHPGQLPVGHLPAQPRRADAGDGHRRGTRLHVRGVRQGPADEGERRHPAPARPAAGERPQPDRAVHRPAAVAARLAGAVLRRRDRHGRQHLARRPRRRAHPDAVDAGPQRRLLHRQPRPALPAGQPGPGVRLPGGQRGGPARQLHLAAELDPYDAGRAPPARGVRRRHVPRARRLEPVGAGLPARERRRRRALRQQPVALPAADRAQPAALERVHPGRADRARELPADRPAAVPADPARARLLLVPAVRGRRRSNDAAFRRLAAAAALVRRPQPAPSSSVKQASSTRARATTSTWCWSTSSTPTAAPSATR